MLRTIIASVLATLMLASPTYAQPISVIRTDVNGNSFTRTITAASPSGYDVHIDVQLSQVGGAALSVRATAPNVIIRSVTVAVHQHGLGSIQPQASVFCGRDANIPGSSLQLVERVQKTAGNGELWVHIDAQGNVGDPTNTLVPDVVEANVIGSIIANGAIHSSIIATGRVSGLPGSISRVESLSSDVLGNISAPAGSVVTAQALNGTIGSAFTRSRSVHATTSLWYEPKPSMPTSAPTPPRAATSRRSAPTTARSAAR